MELLWCIALIVVNLSLSGVIVYLVIAHAKEKADLHDRLMSRNWQDYQYIKKDLPMELKHKEEMLKKEREKPPLSPEEQARKNAASRM